MFTFITITSNNNYISYQNHVFSFIEIILDDISHNINRKRNHNINKMK